MPSISSSKYTVIHFPSCPSFKEVAEMSKEWFIIKTHLRGCYGIVLEKKGNCKVNYEIH